MIRKKFKKHDLIDIIKYPIITDKTTRSIENNIYYFNVATKSNKIDIKLAIENIFDVKVKKVNTLHSPPKTRTIGKFKGRKAKYKKAIVQLHREYQINLFEDQE